MSANRSMPHESDPTSHTGIPSVHPLLSAIRQVLGCALAVFLLSDLTFLRDACLAGLGITLLFEAHINRKWSITRTPLDLPLFLFMLAAVLSLLTAVDPAYSLVQLRGEMFRNILLFYAVVSCFRTERECLPVFVTFLVMGVVVMTHGAIDFFEKGGSVTTLIPYRARSFFDDFQYYGTVLVQMAPFFLLLPLWFARRRIAVIASLLLLLLTGVSVFITHARWVWIVFLVQFVVCGFLLYPRKRTLIAFGLAVLFIVWLIPTYLWRHELPGSHVRSSSHARVILYEYSLERAAQDPFRGIGYGRHSFLKAYPDFVEQHVETMWHAHNLYVNALLQMGVQGLAALLFLLFRIVKVWWPRNPATSPKGFSFYVVSAAFVMIAGFFLRNVADDLFVDTPLNLFWFLLALSYPPAASSRRNAVSAGGAPDTGAPAVSRKPVGILYVFASLPVGGAEKLLYTELQRLNRKRFRPLVCSLRDPGPMGERIRRELGVPVIPLQARRFGWFGLRVVWTLKRILQRERIRIVHTHLHDGSRYGRLAARLAGVPVVVATFHNVYTRPRRRHHWINRFLARYTDVVLTVSHAVERDVIRYDRVAPEKIRVLYNTIDIPEFQKPVDRDAVREQFGARPDDVVLGCVARLEEQKGHAYLIEAMGVLVPRHPRLKLLLAGDGRLRDVLQERSRALAIESNVVFVGTSDRIPEFLKALDLFVLPSLWEGFPLVLGEAMVSGVPVVCTDVGGASELVVHGENGVIVPPGDPEALAGAVERFLQDPRGSRIMAVRAREDAENRFSPGTHMTELERLYVELLQSKGIRVNGSPFLNFGSDPQ